VAGTRKGILLRLDPAVHDALARWAGDELRSTNAQIEFLLRAALVKAGRMPTGAGRIPRRGRPPRDDTTDDTTDGQDATDDNIDASFDDGTEENTVDSPPAPARDEPPA
jgi:hypothetical protein